MPNCLYDTMWKRVYARLYGPRKGSVSMGSNRRRVVRKMAMQEVQGQQRYRQAKVEVGRTRLLVVCTISESIVVIPTEPCLPLDRELRGHKSPDSSIDNKIGRAHHEPSKQCNIRGYLDNLCSIHTGMPSPSSQTSTTCTSFPTLPVLPITIAAFTMTVPLGSAPQTLNHRIPKTP